MRFKNLLYCLVLSAFCASPLFGEETQRMSLSLSEVMMRARRNSVDAEVALNQLKSAYWEYRSYRAELLPEVSLNATLPSYRKQYSSYMNNDGSYSFVRNNYLQMDGELSVTQNIWLTGGKVSVNTSLDFYRQLGSPAFNRYMTIPVALTLTQPIFGVNNLKWDRKIEPVRYSEAKAQFLSATENVALTAINYYFSLLMAQENHSIAEQNLENAERLYVDIVPEIPVDVPEVEINYGDALEKALANNKFAKNMLRRQLEADYEVAKAKGAQREINLFAQIGYTGTDKNFAGGYQNLKDNQVVEIGFEIPLVDWGRRKGKVKVAESNRKLVESQVRQENMNFNQNLFILVERYGNQLRQLETARRADEIAQKRYATNVETFLIGKISTLDLNDSRVKKDEARREYVNELYRFWNYYYQIRSLTLWDYQKDTGIDADFDSIIK